jgi:hypothetical protein
MASALSTRRQRARGNLGSPELSSSQRHNCQAVTRTFDFGFDGALTLVNQGFQDDRSLLGYVRGNRVKSSYCIERYWIMPASSVDLAQMYFGKPIAESPQQGCCFRHTRIDLPCMTYIKAKLSRRKSIENRAQFGSDRWVFVCPYSRSVETCRDGAEQRPMTIRAMYGPGRWFAE